MTEAQNRRAVDAARWIVFLPFSMGTYVLLALCGMAIIDSYRRTNRRPPLSDWSSAPPLKLLESRSPLAYACWLFSFSGLPSM